jgi:hypothetical protein
MSACRQLAISLFGWLVPDGWCCFVLREKYCWLIVGGWFVLREKYCWLVADKPSEQADGGTIPYSLQCRKRKKESLGLALQCLIDCMCRGVYGPYGPREQTWLLV